MPYLNVDETEAALETAALSYPGLCTLITLPDPTPEGRTSHAVRLRAGSRPSRHGVLLIGGVHAREWGSSDILVSFVEALLGAYTGGLGLSWGGAVYTAGEVQAVLENIELLVFPDVNPDGKLHSQTVYAMWRRNRRPIPGTTTIGTDINRNYDFLWDFRTAFDPAAWISVSDTPGNNTYHGTAPFSEPEANNVKHLLDTYPSIRLLIDVHSYSELFLYPWGDDNNQAANPDQNFRNPAWNGQRGRPGGYGEYVHSADLSRWTGLCTTMRDALRNVRNRYYLVGQGFSTLYPTCGTSHCYAFSRHLVDHTKGKTDGFLIEWGLSFQPDYATEMVEIIKDVSSALFKVCLLVDRIPKLHVNPRNIDFKRVRIGTSKTRTIHLVNVGTAGAAIVATTVEAGPDAAYFAPTAPAASTLAAGGTAAVSTKFTPDAARAYSATLLIEVRQTGAAWSELTRVPLQGSGCALPSKACAAPVFAPMGVVEYLLFLLYCLVVLVVLSFFAWIPSVACQIRRLAYQLNHAFEGNDDPCKTV